VNAKKKYSSDHRPVAATYTLLEEAPVPTPTPIVIPDRWARVKFRGVTVDNDLKYRLLVMERKLGYRLTLVQGINPGGVSASAGTHDGPAVDLAEWDWENKVRVGREFAALAIWHRTPAEGPWKGHNHAVPIGNINLSPAARAQVADYLHDPPRNGLANHAPDTFPWHPDPVVPFDYEGAVRDLYRLKRIKGLQARIKGLRDRISAIRARMAYTGKKAAS
jgi:hypothetical protein